MQNMICRSLDLIRKGLEASENPAVLCSFGKDSITMLHMVRSIDPSVPVIYFREPFFPRKSKFANRMAIDWDLVVYDYPPVEVHPLQNDGAFELIKLYSIGANNYIFMPFGIEGYEEGEKYFCAKNDLMGRPTATLTNFSWDTLFIGHKSVDANPLLGDVPVLEDTAEFKETTFYYPMRHWTNADIWEYIHNNNVPYNEERYGNDAERAGHEYSEDFCKACYKCLDFNEGGLVMCPKTSKYVENIAPSREQNEQLFEVYRGKFNNIEVGRSA